VYTPWEAADLLGAHRQTVLRWVKVKGLRADRSSRPWLIEGRDLRAFLGERHKALRCKLDPHHCYCLGCKGPREPDGKIADYVQQTSTTGMLMALCPACGNVMNKVIRRADLEAIRARIDVMIQKADARIVSRERASSNVIFKAEAQTHAKAQR